MRTERGEDKLKTTDNYHYNKKDGGITIGAACLRFENFAREMGEMSYALCIKVTMGI